MFVGGALTAVTFHLHAAAWAGLVSLYAKKLFIT